ncbi:MAG: hypothetical protein KGJ13_02235 [Patescibacteria group bacterium]|nr:hypothetical protein [Patescibacteria group bacterium]
MAFFNGAASTYTPGEGGLSAEEQMQLLAQLSQQDDAARRKGRTPVSTGISRAGGIGNNPFVVKVHPFFAPDTTKIPPQYQHIPADSSNNPMFPGNDRAIPAHDSLTAPERDQIQNMGGNYSQGIDTIQTHQPVYGWNASTGKMEPQQGSVPGTTYVTHPQNLQPRFPTGDELPTAPTLYDENGMPTTPLIPMGNFDWDAVPKAEQPKMLGKSAAIVKSYNPVSEQSLKDRQNQFDRYTPTLADKGTVMKWQQAQGNEPAYKDPKTGAESDEHKRWAENKQQAMDDQANAVQDFNTYVNGVDHTAEQLDHQFIDNPRNLADIDPQTGQPYIHDTQSLKKFAPADYKAMIKAYRDHVDYYLKSGNSAPITVPGTNKQVLRADMAKAYDSYGRILFGTDWK